jgi:hypothetical protein
VCVCVCDLLGVGLRIVLLPVSVAGVALVITTISLIIITPLIVTTIALYLHVGQLKGGRMKKRFLCS